MILVTGANGQLGSSFKKLSVQERAFDFVFVSRADMSIADETAVTAIFEKHKPDICINCAAYTAVDAAETNQQDAYLINATGAAILAKVCQLFNVRFIHMSTDYVFNGDGNLAYKESDPVDPLSIYGASKQKGEELVLMHHPAAVIIRTSWVYSEFGKNFVKTMLRLMQEKPEIKVVNDQFGSPTYATDLAEAIITIIKSDTNKPGIYHYSNAGVINWFEFAVAIKNLIGSTCIVHPIPTSEYPTPAKRPAYSVLDTKKIAGSYSISIPEWQESLRVCLENMDVL